MNTLRLARDDVERRIQGGLLAVLVAVWLAIAVWVAALLAGAFGPAHPGHAASVSTLDSTLGTLLPSDPAAQSARTP